MRKKTIIIIAIAVLAVVVVAAALIFFMHPPAPPEPPATPDEMPRPEMTAPHRPVPPPSSQAPATTAASDKTADQKQKEEKATKVDFYKEFEEYPKHFVTHGVRPGDEMSSEYYFHATLEIYEDGTIRGTYFSNLDSTEDKTVENTADWTGKIKTNRVFRTESGSYYFYLKDVKYDKKPGTGEESDGKTINYVYGYGLSEKADNKIELFAPGTLIDKIPAGSTEMDIRMFLSMMRKNGESDALECFFLRGKDNSCYVSLSDEEAAMAAQGGDQGEEPAPPEMPAPPQAPEHP